MIRVAEINRFNELYELKHIWNDLLAKCKDKHIFLTWEYISTYWKHFGKERKLRLLCAMEKDKIIGIAPLRESKFVFANSFSYNVIEPLGYRGGAGHGADYTGLILAEKELDCFKAFLSYLVEQDDWDFIYLYDIPGTSVIPELLRKASKDVPMFEIIEGAVCPYIPIPSSMDIFMKKLRKKFRSNLRRRMRKLERDYRKVEFKRYDEVGSVRETMRIFMKLHQKRFNAISMPGEFATKKIRNFYFEVAENFASNGWLALHFLIVDDDPIAADYSYYYEEKLYSALNGFDPNYSKYSPMHLLTLKVIEKCINEGVKEYDLLKGGEPYKFDYTSTYRKNLGIRFVNNNFTSNMYNIGIKIAKKAGIEKVMQRFLKF